MAGEGCVMRAVAATVTLLCALQTATAARAIGDPGDFVMGMQPVGLVNAHADRVLLRKGPRKFVWVDWHVLHEKSSCRLHSYAPRRHPSPGSGVLCAGNDDANCVDPCQQGYQRTGSGACQQVCPAEAGYTQECPATRTCVRKGTPCPNLPEDVPYECPAPATLLATCAKQQYQSKELRLASWLCNLQVRDYLGNWQCAEHNTFEACAAGFVNGTAGLCSQRCPHGWLDCGGACSMPGLGCDPMVRPAYLCPLPPLPAAPSAPSKSIPLPLGAAAKPQEEACSLAVRTQQALQTACLSEGVSKGTAGCPMTLTLQGGCGGGRLQVASGLRTQGTIEQIEAWWDRGVDAILAIRVRYGRGQEQVVGNRTRAETSPPGASISLEGATFIISLRAWRSRRAADGEWLSPVLARLEIVTNTRQRFVAGGPLPQLPNHQRLEAAQHGVLEAQLETIARHREEAAAAAEAAAKADPAGVGAGPAEVPMEGGEPSTDFEGSVHLRPGAGLGSGIAIGAAAYSSQAAVHAFGLLFMDRLPSTEL